MAGTVLDYDAMKILELIDEELDLYGKKIWGNYYRGFYELYTISLLFKFLKPARKK